jgi:mannose-6-phosphate isomerase-like protein (cupin superfamily)
MSKMGRAEGSMMRIQNIQKMDRNVGKDTLGAALPKGMEVVRDPYVLYNPEETLAGATVGYAFIYPGCRAGGHYHDSVEEIYHVVRGRGRMIVGNDSYEIEEGDTFCVPLFAWHSTENIGKGTLELYWILAPVAKDRIPKNGNVVGVPPEVKKDDLEKYRR